MIEPVHLIRISAIDQPGTIEVISAAFSSRGIALDALFAPGKRVHVEQEHGVSLVYRASPRRHALMMRILRRMACVHHVEELESPAESHTTGGPGPLGGQT